MKLTTVVTTTTLMASSVTAFRRPHGDPTKEYEVGSCNRISPGHDMCYIRSSDWDDPEVDACSGTFRCRFYQGCPFDGAECRVPYGNTEFAICDIGERFIEVSDWNGSDYDRQKPKPHPITPDEGHAEEVRNHTCWHRQGNDRVNGDKHNARSATELVQSQVQDSPAEGRVRDDANGMFETAVQRRAQASGEDEGDEGEDDNDDDDDSSDSDSDSDDEGNDEGSAIYEPSKKAFAFKA